VIEFVRFVPRTDIDTSPIPSDSTIDPPQGGVVLENYSAGPDTSQSKQSASNTNKDTSI
jgi:hypothetical protein